MATQTLYALFQDVLDAERAIGALQDHGIPATSIGVVARRPAEEEEAGRVRTQYARVTDREDEALGEPEAMYEPQPGALPPASLASTAAPVSSVDTPQNVEVVGKEGLTTTTPQDAAAGAAVGTGVGLVAGLLAAAVAIMVPGVGLILGGGVLAAALGATVATTAAGAAVGGAAGYLRDMGMPEQAAVPYADRLHEGDYLISVIADSSQYDDLKRTLMKYNAAGVDVNVNAAGEAITEAWGADPALVGQLNRASARAACVYNTPALTAATDPMPQFLDEAATPSDTVPATPATPVSGPAIVTEALDGTPIIPAKVVEVSPQR